MTPPVKIPENDVIATPTVGDALRVVFRKIGLTAPGSPAREHLYGYLGRVLAHLLGFSHEADGFREDAELDRYPPGSHAVPARVLNARRCLKVIEMSRKECRVDDPCNCG